MDKIKVAEELGKIPGMDNAPWCYIGKGSGLGIGNFSASSVIKESGLTLHGPWLKIDDDSEWSSAKILALSGRVLNFDLHNERWYLEKEISGCETSVYFLGVVLQCDNPELDEPELAHNLAILALYKINPESLKLPKENK